MAGFSRHHADHRFLKRPLAMPGALATATTQRLKETIQGAASPPRDCAQSHALWDDP